MVFFIGVQLLYLKSKNKKAAPLHEKKSLSLEKIYKSFRDMWNVSYKV